MEQKIAEIIARLCGADAEEIEPELELFEEFYELQNNQPMSNLQAAFVKDMIEGLLG